MGLDMFVYAVYPEQCLSYDDLSYKLKEGDKPEELFYWRKHHDLHGAMEQLYRQKGGTEEFNCVPVRLTIQDLDNLANNIVENSLPQTTGLFFGNNPPDDESIKKDLNFIQQARTAIENGKLVYYNSWW